LHHSKNLILAKQEQKGEEGITQILKRNKLQSSIIFFQDKAHAIMPLSQNGNLLEYNSIDNRIRGKILFP
jgi:hypothetical protein